MLRLLSLTSLSPSKLIWFDQNITTVSGAPAGTRNSSMGPQWRIDPKTKGWRGQLKGWTGQLKGWTGHSTLLFTASQNTDYMFLLNSQSCSCGYLEGTDYLYLLNSQSCSCGYLEGSPFFLSWSYFVTASLYLCRFCDVHDQVLDQMGSCSWNVFILHTNIFENLWNAKLLSNCFRLKTQQKITQTACTINNPQIQIILQQLMLKFMKIPL